MSTYWHTHRVPGSGCLVLTGLSVPGRVSLFEIASGDSQHYARGKIERYDWWFMSWKEGPWQIEVALGSLRVFWPFDRAVLPHQAAFVRSPLIEADLKRIRSNKDRSMAEKLPSTTFCNRHISLQANNPSILRSWGELICQASVQHRDRMARDA